MSDELTSTDAEHYLQALSHVMTQPYSRECLVCFVARMIEEFGCDNTLRWAVRYRDLRVPRATRLERRLGEMGGFCDCEILINAYQRSPNLARFDRAAIDHGRTPVCLEVARGSTQPCAAWMRIRRDA